MKADFDWRTKRAKRPLPVWIDAFLRDTQHLSPDEVGAYLLILMAMWSRAGCDFPDDDRRLARLCRVSPRLWKTRIGPALRPFFETAGGLLISKRLSVEAEQIERQYRDKGQKVRTVRRDLAAAAQPAPRVARPVEYGPVPAARDKGGASEDPALYEAVLAAAEIDWTRDVTGKWLGSTQRWHVSRWRDLGLSQVEVLGVIAESRPRGSPPGSRPGRRGSTTCNGPARSRWRAGSRMVAAVGIDPHDGDLRGCLAAWRGRAAGAPQPRDDGAGGADPPLVRQSFPEH